jgi:hypothetical protein
MGGEEVLSSPPPEPSPIKGEGSGSKVTCIKCLPLPALDRGRVWVRVELRRMGLREAAAGQGN